MSEFEYYIIYSVYIIILWKKNIQYICILLWKYNINVENKIIIIDSVYLLNVKPKEVTH